ncbi:MAG TPA: penicillin acylase family protein [Aquihabitans sp.]|jgi:acyl-homoserine lactone acylase PvdQ|nr:penicillin acylase family protein [Aquihabitans sp.]
MHIGLRRFATSVACAGTLVASLAQAPALADRSAAPLPGDRAYYVLPPGNYGGLPPTDESRDQLPLYDALTPLRGNVTDADIEANFLPEDFEPVGPTRVEPTGRPGTTITYDSYGVAHVEGVTRADLAFGAGWVTARDRGLLLQLGQGPARAAVADVPGINAFSLVTSGQTFVPSAQAEQLVTDQVDLLIETYGDKGREIVADAQAMADGVNAYRRANGVALPPVGVNDVIATTAFIGSIFGAGGGAEATNAELLDKLQNALGKDRGRDAWDDAMLFQDPEAPTTTRRGFPYGPFTGGGRKGSVIIDEGSIVSLDPRQPATGAPAATQTATATAAAPAGAGEASAEPTFPAAGAVPGRQASNFLMVSPRRSATGNSLAVMGPQLGYYYPEIVQQIHLSGPGIEAQGVAVPGAAMYLLIGRTADYAWSLTSANHDVRDVFVEVLCNPDGSAPTRASTHHVFQGECRPFERFDAGTLNGTPLRYPVSVHGPIIGTATVDGVPVALSRARSTLGREGLNLAALKDMTEGRATSADRFFQAANQFEFTFNWAYASRTETAFFSSGRLPVRARGLDRRLPTLGTGGYEWQGFLAERQHPHDVHGPNGLLLNWNNQSAPGFMHGDDTPFGSVHRVELFDRFPERPTLADTVSVMNRAATEDVRSPVWPVISRVLRSGPAPSGLDAQVVAVLDEWVQRDAPRLDADLDGDYDDAGATLMDALWRPLAEAVMRPVYGDLLDDLDRVRNLNGQAGQSLVEKDLRTILRDRGVKGKFELRYCGRGDLAACRDSLWAVVHEVAARLAAEQGTDPARWTSTAARTGFTPGLIPDTIRTTNRPTFQQVIELVNPNRRRR